jgi:hypothetical protein
VSQSLELIDRLRSDLQERILKHICKTTDADYKTIIGDVKKNRITVLQALKPLLRGVYIKQIKVDPKHKRSRVVFKPTVKGIAYASTILSLGLEFIKKKQLTQEEFKVYREFVKDVIDPAERERNERAILRVCLQFNLFDEQGDVIDQDRLLNQLFRTRLLDYASNPRFDPKDLFKPEGIGSLKRMSLPSEVIEFREYLEIFRSNLDRTIKELAR